MSYFYFQSFFTEFLPSSLVSQADKWHGWHKASGESPAEAGGLNSLHLTKPDRWAVVPTSFTGIGLQISVSASLQGGGKSMSELGRAAVISEAC